MYGILKVNNSPSGNNTTFVRSCHEYPDIFITISKMSSTSVNFLKIDTKLYTCKIRVYDIEYLSGVYLRARVGNALVVR